MLKWIGATALGAAAGVATTVSAFLLLPAPSAVAPAATEQAVVSKDVGHSVPPQPDEEAEATHAADIQRFLSSSGPTLSVAEPDEGSLISQVLPVVTFASSAPAGDGEQTHLVAEGETLWGIAVEYGVKIQDLAARNGLAPDAWVAAGDTLVIPTFPLADER